MNCPHLTSLEINCVSEGRKLKAAGPGCFTETRSLLERNKNRAIKTTSEHLTNVILEGALFKDDLLDLLGTYLPNIESLKCTERSTYYGDSSNFRNLVLNLTAFKRLNHFYIDIGKLFEDVDGTEVVFVRFKYPDSEIENCYKVTKSTGSESKDDNADEENKKEENNTDEEDKEKKDNVEDDEDMDKAKLAKIKMRIQIWIVRIQQVKTQTNVTEENIDTNSHLLLLSI